MNLPRRILCVVSAAVLLRPAVARGVTTPGLYEQGPKLVGDGAIGESQQGVAVALSADGNTAIVGGFSDDSTVGAAWVFVRVNGAWSQQQKLVGSGYSGTPRQGTSVALSADGNTALVGGPADASYAGAAWVFTRSGGVWAQQGGKLVASGNVGTPGLGVSAALSADGNTALVGGSSDASGAGAAWVFTRSGGTWTQQGSKLVGTGAVGLANQGISCGLSADGNTALLGGYGDDSQAGAAWVFTRSGGVWTQQGGKLVGTGGVGQSRQGLSVSLSGDGNTAILGGFGDSSFKGAAWVFARSGGVWSQQGDKLVGSGGSASGQQGVSVSLSGDGNSAIVGGPLDTGNGAAWVFARSQGVWTQRGPKLVGTGAILNAEQGESVALSSDGSTAIVGGFFDDSAIGAAWILDHFVVKGDVNGDGAVNVADAFALINFLFAGGPSPH